MPRVWTAEQREKARQTRLANKAKVKVPVEQTDEAELLAKLQNAEKQMAPTPEVPAPELPVSKDVKELTREELEQILFKSDSAMRQQHTPPKVEIRREGDHQVIVNEVPEYRVDDTPKGRPDFVEENRKGWVDA